MRLSSSLLLSSAFVIALVAGCDEGSPTAPDGGVPDACTVQLDDPTTLTIFPDRALLVPDATTETGLRLHYDPARYSGLTERLGGFLPTLTEDLSEVDGFGVNAAAFFQFGRVFDEALLPPADQETPASVAGFVVLGDTPELVPAVVTTSADGTLFLTPLRPLPPRAEVAAYVTRALTQAAGGCLEPSAATEKLLASPDAPTAAAVGALVQLGAITRASELVAITTYPTQSIYEDGVAISADVAGRSFELASPPMCEDTELFTRCVAAFVAGDYRDADGVIRRAAGAAAPPKASYTIPLTVWLPLERGGPLPTVIFQHGLTSNREYGGSRLAEHFAPLGIAVVAIDAVEHGEHPTVTEPREAIDTLQAFFRISFETIDTRAFEVARMRDNFAQSTFDRLQLVRLLTQHPDVDGVAGADLDMGRLALMGVSAGGIMSVQHVALDGAIDAAVLAVPGGRIGSMIKESVAFAPLVALLRPIQASEDDILRLYPVVQTVADRGDPASWAPTLHGQRVSGVTGRPDVLVGIAPDDQVMPNVATNALGRALGLPMVEKVVRPELGFERVSGPIVDNVATGDERATAGFLQFDVVDGPDGLVAVDHNNLLPSGVGVEAWSHFLTTHFAGAAEIRDPYEALGIVRP